MPYPNTSSGSTTERGADGAGDGNVNPAGVPIVFGAPIGVTSAAVAPRATKDGRRALPPPRSLRSVVFAVGVPVVVSLEVFG